MNTQRTTKVVMIAIIIFAAAYRSCLTLKRSYTYEKLIYLGITTLKAQQICDTMKHPKKLQAFYCEVDILVTHKLRLSEL